MAGAGGLWNSPPCGGGAFGSKGGTISNKKKYAHNHFKIK